jgi:adenosylhomocysteinase
MPSTYKVKDISLAKQGSLNIEWAERDMPVLLQIRERFKREKPLKGLRIAACLHVTKETAVLARTLRAGGAEVALCGSNPLSTQDDVAAALAKEGFKVFAWRGETNEEYYQCLNKALEIGPNITLDDGADLISAIHSKRRELLKGVIAGQEETTTGVVRLRAMAKDKALRYPVIAVNDAKTKMMFDNRYGTGSSTIDGIMRATNVLLAGKNFVIAGYGWCGRGLAMRARGMGANVIVTEVDATKALEARMDGFRVMAMREASKVGDVFVTATGDVNVIAGKHFALMKDGAILANTGHFNVEICLPDLEKMKKGKRLIKPNVEEYVLKNGRRLYVLAQGRLVNLACAEGHPSEVMDMSFSNQALCCDYLAKLALAGRRLENRVYEVPGEIDEQVARLKLRAMGVEIDSLTEEQRKYLNSWEAGT